MSEWETTLQRLVAQAYVLTVESAIINGDTVLTASTNINLIDGTPAGTEHYTICDGLRKTAIATTAPNGDPDLGTVDIADVFTLISILGNLFSEDRCLFLTNTATSLKLAALDQFTNAATRGTVNTITGTSKIPALCGVDLIRHEYFPLTNANGKVSATASNNTKGGLLLFRKDAVQWGDSGQMSFKLYDFGAQGVQLEFWTYIAITIINQKAGETTFSNVAYGINATV